jgi:tRNA nucleotidyltransferase (CCA-adding enzyme)
MQEKIGEICASVLKEVTPKKSERIKIETLIKKIKRRILSTSKELGIEIEVGIEGSVARDTWLSKDPDIDIFMCMPKAMPRKFLEDNALKIARKATTGSEQIERFAEHPYLEAIMDKVRVNIVPCYKVNKGEWLSSTDRTPFHTVYVKKQLNEQMRSEVRILKKFMKGINVYGAEIKIGGFSGYLNELLIIHYKSFINTLKAFAHYNKRLILDIENLDEKKELQSKFRESLVIIDPVDKRRNAASSVKPDALSTLIAASRAFLKHPSISFFYPEDLKKLKSTELKRKIEKQKSTLIFLVFKKIDTVSDVLWGQLYKTQRSLNRLLQLNGFNIYRTLSWSDERNINIIIFELEQRIHPSIIKHIGPPIEKKQECEKFLKKYLGDENTILGPYINDARWIVHLQRKYTDAVKLLYDTLVNGGRSIGVANKISQVLCTGFKIYVNEEIIEIYQKNNEFAHLLTKFLSGKPLWLETGTY